MKYRRFGKTELEVSEIGFGAWAIGGNRHGNSYGPTNDKDSLKAIKKAIDMGCNFFDTADVYGHGHSEKLLGEAFEGKREKYIIATKVGGDFYNVGASVNFRRDYIRFAIEKSLKRLRTDYIDIYQLHNPNRTLIRKGEVFETLQGLKKEGKIRYTGISIFDSVEGIEAMKIGNIESIQVIYNIFNQEPLLELFPTAKSRGVGIIAREPLANSFLTGKYDSKSKFPQGDIRASMPMGYKLNMFKAAEKLKFLTENRDRTMAQAALKFVLLNDAVSVVIPGIKNEQQAEENLKAGDSKDLTQEEIMKIESLVQKKFYL